MELKDLKGLGPKRLALLEEKNIRTADDLLHFLPVSYIDNSVLTPVKDLSDGDCFSVRLTVTAGPSFFSRRGLKIVTFYGSDEHGMKASLKWFNQPFRATSIIVGHSYVFCGRVSQKPRKPVTLLNPSVSDKLNGIIPVYPRIGSIPNAILRKWMIEISETVPLAESLPERVIERNKLFPLKAALLQAHFPTDMEALSSAYYRLRFEKALLYFLYLGIRRRQDIVPCGVAFNTEGACKSFQESLPFPLTGGQINAISDIAEDMAKSIPMNRLIQGDVGCGKTAVAEFAAYVCDYSGRQCVFMAPTELLACQQFENMRKRFGPRCGLLTGSIDSAMRKTAIESIENGQWRVIVGTHALFSEDVHYRDLALVITDEQHRFGVEQRARIMRKGEHPDVLVMSATPIPRTLALMLYGDLDVSIIRDMPAGRLPVKTHLVGASRRNDMYKYLAEEAGQGRRTYVVCPLIDTPEEGNLPSVSGVYSELASLLPSARVGVLHGRMKEKEKQEAIHKFAVGDTDILVSTTVIEVGIHVPEAVHMVIEGADNFGLSSLHQLRGRVGRGREQGHCYLSISNPGSTALERLKVLTSTTDGFEVAEMDMKLRGSGDLLGVRQSGESTQLEFIHGCGYELLEKARDASEDILSHMTGECIELLERAENCYGRGDVALN